MGWDGPVMLKRWNDWLRSKYATGEKVRQAWSGTNQTFELGSVPIPKATDAPGSRELLDYQRFREELADEWTRRQVSAIKAADPQALATVGLIQWSVPSLLPGVRHYAGFRPERQARLLDFMEIHFYPLDRGAYEYRNDEEEARNLAYLQSVVGEVAKTTNRWWWPNTAGMAGASRVLTAGSTLLPLTSSRRAGAESWWRRPRALRSAG